VTFATLLYFTPLLHPLPPLALWAVRAALTMPFVGVVLVVLGRKRQITDIAARVRRQPWLLLGVLACGLLLSVQLWVFGWGPLNGHSLDVSLGYFLLPLVLVVIGRFVYHDRLQWWHWAAAAVAALGVAWELVRVGHLSWLTLVIALGYPIYFVLRRSLGIANLGGMFWEFLAVFPLAAVVLGWELTCGTAFAANPALWWAAPGFGLLAALALLFYLLASKLLPLSLFGLMSYVEPALLLVASLLLGERIGGAEWPSYLAIWAAVLILAAGGVRELWRSRRVQRRGREPDAA